MTYLNQLGFVSGGNYKYDYLDLQIIRCRALEGGLSYIDGEVFNMLKNLKILKNKWGVRSGRRRRSRKGLAEAYVCNSQGVLNFGRGVNVLNLVSLTTEGNFVDFSQNSMSYSQ